MRILLVEDNQELATWLAKMLRKDNFAVDCVFDGEDGDHALAVNEYDLAIVDLSLPGMDGLQILRRLRHRGSKLPVIILTANGTLDGRITGLDEGADDYIAKPFEFAELEARIRVQMRRANDQASAVIVYGPLTFDTRTKEFRLDQQPISVTPREHAVLYHLLLKAGKTVSKRQIRDSLFGFDEDVDEAAIEVYVHRLRKKMEGHSLQIRTLRGLGYILIGDEN